jgi:hypothetical protein
MVARFLNVNKGAPFLWTEETAKYLSILFLHVTIGLVEYTQIVHAAEPHSMNPPKYSGNW